MPPSDHLWYHIKMETANEANHRTLQDFFVNHTFPSVTQVNYDACLCISVETNIIKWVLASVTLILILLDIQTTLQTVTVDVTSGQRDGDWQWTCQVDETAHGTSDSDERTKLPTTGYEPRGSGSSIGNAIYYRSFVEWPLLRPATWIYLKIETADCHVFRFSFVNSL